MDPQTTPAAQGPRRLRGWPIAGWLLLGLATVLGSLWGWAQTPGSLATALQGLAWALPAPQKLDISNVRGTLRQGGQLGQIHWQQSGLDVRLQGSEIDLDWSRLLHGLLPVTRVQVTQLHIDDQRPAHVASPVTDLLLPLQVDLPWQVAHMQWAGTSSLSLSQLQGHYRFDGHTHALTLDSLYMAQGRYRAQGTLQAAAPMTLDLQLTGDITASLPAPNTPTKPAKLATPVQSTTLHAEAQVQGSLSGAAAQLQLQARVQPEQASTAIPQLQVEATLRPWQAQAVSVATVKTSQLDLASLWPNAPHTQLTGQVQAKPEGARWLLQGSLSNTLPGPWDKQRLPLQSLKLDIGKEGPDWHISTLDMAWPGGGAQAQGQWSPLGWQGLARIDQLRPDLLDTVLSGPALSGTLQATRPDAGPVQFEALLQPAGALSATVPTGESASFRTHGHWTPGLWTFDQLTVQLAQAQWQGQGQWQTASSSLKGRWTWAWPGLQGQLEGQLAAREGQGQLLLQVQDAQRSLQWLQRWPQLHATLQAWQAQGQAQVSAQWQGGWQQAETRLQMTLDAPSLQLSSSASQRWQGTLTRLTLEGTLQNLQARAQGRWQTAKGLAQVQASAQLRRTNTSSALTGWAGQWQTTQAQWTAGSAQASLQLQAPIDWQWAGPGSALQWGASTWLIQGPSPGAATLQVGSGHWNVQPNAASSAQLNAEVSELPLQWLQLLGVPDLQGDLMLKGQLSLALDQRLSLLARLERSRGRLWVAAEAPPAAPVDAGVRQAFLQLSIQDQDAQLQLQWDTEQAGQLQARLQSRIDRNDPAGWWPAQAPLTGRVSAQLPRVGTWSWLAPPGWRAQGSLDATFDIAGTRDKPLWSGQLKADNLAARSAVEGIEFSQGQLRARLQDQTMVLETFSIKGAGAQGGDIQAQGQLVWPAQQGDAAALQDVQIALQLRANALRISNRADRRLTVSGQLDARMDKGQMQLTGLLKADQAQFTLPDDTTPTLGDDVIVKKPQQMAVAPPSAGRSLMGTPDVRVTLDLGPDFQVQGHGLNTRLAGQLTLQSNAASQGQPRLTGQVRTEGGRFKAYGQQLNIDQGLLRFSGPYDNPNLDIIALRPNLSQRVGVTVTGTALAPRVRLYADPDMPDADKLAWLVLGRSPAGGGAESAVLQQAAVALLGGNGQRLSGNLASALGLDEISVASGSRSGSATSPTTVGANTTTGTAITLGKRLSKDFYLVYESSLSGAFGSLYVFYDLSQRLTLRAQAGDINALDLVYTVRRD